MALLLHEGERQDEDDAVVTMVIDLVKAYERVPLRVVWEWAVQWSFPLDVLAPLMRVFEGHRRLVVEGCHTEATRTRSAIVAGSRFSTALLKMVLMDAMDGVAGAVLGLRLRVYVDDLAIQLRGTKAHVRLQVPAVANMVVSKLEGLSLDASLGKDGKSAVLTRCPKLGTQLRLAMAELGMPWRSEAAYMGLDMRMARRSRKARLRVRG